MERIKPKGSGREEIVNKKINEIKIQEIIEENQKWAWDKYGKKSRICIMV